MTNCATCNRPYDPAVTARKAVPAGYCSHRCHAQAALAEDGED